MHFYASIRSAILSCNLLKANICNMFLKNHIKSCMKNLPLGRRDPKNLLYFKILCARYSFSICDFFFFLGGDGGFAHPTGHAAELPCLGHWPVGQSLVWPPGDCDSPSACGDFGLNPSRRRCSAALRPVCSGLTVFTVEQRRFQA